MSLALEGFEYREGLCELGNGAYAWLQPDGGWGYSNAGLLVDGEASLLVDTLFDLHLTGRMLAAMRDAEPGATARIDTLINTHANGDHCYGNQLVAGAEIIASAAAAEEMKRESPALLGAMVANFADSEAPFGPFVRRTLGRFDFAGIEPTLPTRTFEGELSLRVGDKRIELIQVGPAHTRGDVLVHVPGDRTVFTGDILFVEGTPILWVGPVQNWIDACDRLLAMDVETIVPGHGPITDKRGPAAVKAYLEFIRHEARQRYDAGLDAFEAARDIPLGDYAAWGDAERIVVNTATLYREFAGDPNPGDVLGLFRKMAELAAGR
jgi:cyclase